jgi:hypothetical protein
MPDPQNQAPPPPPGFSPVQDTANVPPPPPGFSPVNQTQVTNSAGETMPADVAARHALTRVGKPAEPAPVDPKTLGPYEGVYKLGQTMEGVLGGAVKEAGKTGVGAFDLLSGGRFSKSGAIAPEDLQTQGAAEGVGGLAEQGAEWAAGDAALEGGLKLLKVAKNAPHLIELIENYPKAAKILMGGAKGAAVGAAQGAVKESAPGGKGTLEGAKEGGEGGAVGGAAGEAISGVVKPLARKFGFATSSEEDAIRALQPGKREYNFTKNWALAKDRLASEIEDGGNFKNMQEAADRIGEVRQNIWNDEVKPAIAKHATETFDTNSVAQAVRDKVTPTLQKNFPEDAKILQQFADKYQSGTPLFGGDKTVDDVEKEIELYNAKLSDKGYWKKTPSERAAMEKANPEIAAWKTGSDAMREGLYTHLEKAGETGIQDLKKTYGAVAAIENDVRSQANVTGRQRPLSLKQVIGMAGGAIHGGPSGVAVGVGIPLFDKWYNSPESLLNRAVKKSQPAGPVKAAAQTVAKKVRENAGAIGGFTGANGVLMLSPDGQPVSMHPEDVDKAKQIGWKPVESTPEKPPNP